MRRRLLAAFVPAAAALAAIPVGAPARCVKVPTFQAMIHNGFAEDRLDPGRLTSSTPIKSYDSSKRKRIAFVRTLVTARALRRKQISLVTFGASAFAFAPRSITAFLAGGTPNIGNASTAPSGSSGTGTFEDDSDFNDAFTKANRIAASRRTPIRARFLFTAKAHQATSQDPAYLGGHRTGPRTHVVAWGPVLQDRAGMAQLRAIAADTGGELYTAAAVSQLPAIARRLASCLDGRRT